MHKWLTATESCNVTSG